MNRKILDESISKKLISLGACTVDTILRVNHIPTGDAKVMAEDGVVVGAGMAVAAAATASILGGSVSVWGRIGSDLLGDFFLADLSSLGIDTRSIRRIQEAKTGLSSVIVDRTGKRLIIPYYDSRLDTDPSWLPISELDNVDCVLADVRWPEGALRILEEGTKRNLIRVFDGDVAEPEVLRKLAPLATHAIFSEPGFKLFSGAENVELALLDSAKNFPGYIGVTLGERGFTWVEGGQIRKILPPEIVPVDTLAAGDVFHGAFGLCISEGMPIDKAGEFACAAAAIKCTRFGGRAGIPGREEVELLVNEAYG